METCKTLHTCGCAANSDDRRTFIKHAAVVVAGAITGLGTAARDAAALPVTFGEPLASVGNELTYPIPAADGATVDRDNGVIVVRFQNQAFAFNLSCPHESAAVRWKGALGRFECSRHDSVYSPVGVYASGRATRNMDRFTIKKNGTSLVVDVSRLIQSDTDKAAWSAAAVAV
jgi:nitrite reductase/ring-hydroxylating ferredoxin subunit